MTLKTLKYTNIKTQIQWNLSNPTHKGTREMCQIVQYVEYSGFILVNRNTLGP